MISVLPTDLFGPHSTLVLMTNDAGKNPTNIRYHKTLIAVMDAGAYPNRETIGFIVKYSKHPSQVEFSESLIEAIDCYNGIPEQTTEECFEEENRKKIFEGFERDVETISRKHLGGSKTTCGLMPDVSPEE